MLAGVVLPRDCALNLPFRLFGYRGKDSPNISSTTEEQSSRLTRECVRDFRSDLDRDGRHWPLTSW